MNTSASSFCPWLFGLAGVACSLVDPLYAATPAAPAFAVHDIKTISVHEGRYFHGWPTLVRLADGRLMAAYSGGRDNHVCPFGRLEVMYSMNNGETWSWPVVAMDSPIDDRDGGILETARGTLLLTSFRSIGFVRADRRAKYVNQPALWERYDQGPSPIEWVEELGPVMLRSEDGGRNWSAPALVPVSSPHGPIQLADGRLLYPGISGVGRGLYIKPGERKCGVWESTDEGRSWRLLSLIPPRPGDDITQYHELHGVEAADGTIVVQIRSHDGREGDPQARHMMQTESLDGGRTWTPVRALGIAGYPPHLLRLKNDWLLMTYDSRARPYGVAARVSKDHGKTWSEPLALTAYDQKRDQGYPSTAQLADGTFVTVWYEEMPESPKAVLRQARWRLQ